MSYNSKYNGAQVEAYIDKIALGELDNVYVTEFTIDELLLVVDSNIPLSIDKDSLVNAVKANKVIAIPYNTDNNGGGCIASVEDYGDVIYFYLKNYYSSIKFFVDTNETNAEITTDYIEVVWWQEALYSGENIKTINGEDILGSGDLELPTKDEVVHKECDETISGVKTFHAPVKFLHTGDNAITIGGDTRVCVEGTTKTVLGLIRGAFFAGSRSYPLFLYGSSERPKYNFDNVELALLSDVSGKQDAIADLEAIRSGAEKGATALQSVPSEYITESELNAKGYATTSQLSGKQDTITDLATIRSGAALGATALQSETYKGTIGSVDADISVDDPSGTVGEYALLFDKTFTEDTDTFSVFEPVPSITLYKDFIVLLEFKYDENDTNRTGYIHFNSYTAHAFNSVRLEKIIRASYMTHYLLRMHIGEGLDKVAYLESHTNSYGNPQYGDGNQGLNMFCLLHNSTYLKFNNFMFAFAFKSGERIRIYGK